MLGEKEMKHTSLLFNKYEFGVMRRPKGQVLDRTWCCSVILTSCSPESTSRRRISMRPSRRSVYKSPIRQVTRPKWEFTHLVKVFFCTASRSSAMERDKPGFTSLGQKYIFAKNTFLFNKNTVNIFDPCKSRVTGHR